MLGLDEVKCRQCGRRHMGFNGVNRVPCIACACGRLVYPWDEEVEEQAVRVDQINAPVPLKEAADRRCRVLAMAGYVRRRNIRINGQSFSIWRTAATLPANSQLSK